MAGLRRRLRPYRRVVGVDANNKTRVIEFHHLRGQQARDPLILEHQTLRAAINAARNEMKVWISIQCAAKVNSQHRNSPERVRVAVEEPADKRRPELDVPGIGLQNSVQVPRVPGGNPFGRKIDCELFCEECVHKWPAAFICSTLEMAAVRRGWRPKPGTA